MKRFLLILQSENTFLLALDGDVDFKPEALQLLVDRLRKNHKVGVVCGRIHPIGSGKLYAKLVLQSSIMYHIVKEKSGCLKAASSFHIEFRYLVAEFGVIAHKKSDIMSFSDGMLTF